MEWITKDEHGNFMFINVPFKIEEHYGFFKF